MASDRTEPSVSAARGDGEEEPLLEGNFPEETALPHIALPSSLSAHIFYFMSIHFLLASCEMVLVAPLIRLFEQSLCLSHYGFPSAGVPERMCKIPEIQHPLATIRGWKSMFDTIPGTSSFNIPQARFLMGALSLTCCYSNRKVRRSSWP
jgi:hypothetical protein